MNYWREKYAPVGFRLSDPTYVCSELRDVPSLWAHQIAHHVQEHCALRVVWYPTGCTMCAIRLWLKQQAILFRPSHATRYPRSFDKCFPVGNASLQCFCLTWRNTYGAHKAAQHITWFWFITGILNESKPKRVRFRLRREQNSLNLDWAWTTNADEAANSSTRDNLINDRQYFTGSFTEPHLAKSKPFRVPGSLISFSPHVPSDTEISKRSTTR